MNRRGFLGLVIVFLSGCLHQSNNDTGGESYAVALDKGPTTSSGNVTVYHIDDEEIAQREYLQKLAKQADKQGGSAIKDITPEQYQDLKNNNIAYEVGDIPNKSLKYKNQTYRIYIMEPLD